MSSDMMALRNFVTQKDEEQFSRLPDGMVAVNVTHSNLKMTMLELKFDLHSTVGDAKDKIYRHTGTKPGMMKLMLKSGGQLIGKLTDDGKKLGYYGIESGMEISVQDDDPYSLSSKGGLEDVTLIQKYRMADEDYDKRDGTLRAWIKEQKNEDPEWVEPWNRKEVEGKEISGSNDPPPDLKSVKGMLIGQRCEIRPGGRRGEIAFIGEVEGIAPGYWVGVRYDEPVGKNDGTVKGKCIFEAPQMQGGFVRGKNVAVGDYPERLHLLVK
eukprot:81664_1